MCLADDVIDKAFPLWIAMLSLCFNHWVSLLSPDFSVICFPISYTMFLVEGPNAPDVSIATGSNLNLLTRSGYLALLEFSAFAAAWPTSIAVSFMQLSPKVLTHVASQHSALP